MKDIDSEVVRFKPFLHLFTDYMGRRARHTFTCPVCGGHNCEKMQPTGEPRNFWSGHYRCTDCGNTKDEKGYPICYYSDCFIREEIDTPVQLSLFDDA